MSPNPTVINQFNQFDTTMDKVLFFTFLILTLSLIFSTIYFLFKYKLKIETFMFISITGLIYIVCTTPLLQNINTDGFSDHPLEKIILFTTCMSLLSIIEGILLYAFISLIFKLLFVSIGDDKDISIKYTAIYIYCLIIIMLLFTIIPFIFFSTMDSLI